MCGMCTAAKVIIIMVVARFFKLFFAFFLFTALLFVQLFADNRSRMKKINKMVCKT